MAKEEEVKKESDSNKIQKDTNDGVKTEKKLNKKVLMINGIIIFICLSFTILVIFGTIIVPGDDSVFVNTYKFFAKTFGTSIKDLNVEKHTVKIDNSTVNEYNKLNNKSNKQGAIGNYSLANVSRLMNQSSTNMTNKTIKKPVVVKCTPKKTCADYPGICGVNLSDGCNKNMTCSNCDKCLNKEIFCSDKRDEDCDGYTDCADVDCYLDKSCKMQYTENLFEISERKVRVQKRFNRWNFTYLEDPNTFLWQPETLQYKEQKTGKEVWKLTGAINYSNKYNEFEGMEVWSYNGENIYFMSYRPTNSFNNYNSFKRTYEPILMVMNTNGNNFNAMTERPLIYREPVSRYYDSPDGTKSAWQSDYMNMPNKTDVYFSVNYYPYPPSDISAKYDGGVIISWQPPMYEEKYTKEIKRYHIWRSDKPDSNWKELGAVDASYYTEGTEVLPYLESLNIIDRTSNRGTYYYAVTSEEYSGLESDELSDIIKVVFSNNDIESSGIERVKGTKNFWREKPEAPSDFAYKNTTMRGVYVLSWTEPDNDKIKYYNIYYTNKGNATIDQKYRIVSIAKGNSNYIDFYADINKSANYGISSVDRYGNEGNIVLRPLNRSSLMPAIQKKPGFFDGFIEGIIKFFGG